MCDLWSKVLPKLHAKLIRFCSNWTKLYNRLYIIYTGDNSCTRGPFPLTPGDESLLHFLLIGSFHWRTTKIRLIRPELSTQCSLRLFTVFLYLCLNVAPDAVRLISGTCMILIIFGLCPLGWMHSLFRQKHQLKKMYLIFIRLSVDLCCSTQN